jgi:UDP-N-acetyl-D-mannosaminuronic acid transferase (WecB/TagA/CpsF family)
VAEKLAERLEKNFPAIWVVGTRTGTHRSFRPDEEQELVRQISQARPTSFGADSVRPPARES